jgi:Cft2 family RNA processing exonuclease
VTRHVTWDKGVSLVGHDFWLDPLVGRATAFISHAHTDHARRHQVAVLTAETLALVRTNHRPHEPRVVAYGDRLTFGDAALTLLPAGHMLGSAQLLFEHDGARLLYTGDMKLRLGNGRETPVPQADVLVIESTYGRPHFLFPEPDAALEELALLCRRSLDSGVVPVLLAHALGKSQELMLALKPYGFSFALEPRCLPHARAYAGAGVPLPDFVELDPETECTRVVIAPPTGKVVIRQLRRYRTVLVSGWAQDREFSRLFGADMALPLSDHCDFDELVRVVERSGAEQVYTVHGFSEDLARHLRKRGVRASALSRTEQLAFAI